MARWWTDLFDRVWDHIVVDEPATKNSGVGEESPETIQAIDKAREDWIAARLYFDSVTDPDLIDHAIYSIEAAERKYMYLLRRAKKLGHAVNALGSDPHPLDVGEASDEPAQERA